MCSLSLTCQDDGKPALRVGAGGSQREDYAAGKFDEVKSACTLTVTGWDFEAAIPWTALGVADLSATFGISLKQNDDFPEDSSPESGNVYLLRRHHMGYADRQVYAHSKGSARSRRQYQQYGFPNHLVNQPFG